MSYEVIGVDEYGSFAKNVKNEAVCHKCKYFNYHKHANPCKSCLEVYYYPNHLEIAKHEAEQQLCADAYNSDSQKELIDLQIENKQLKERVAAIETYLDEVICLSKETADNFNSVSMEMSANCSDAMAIAYQNVLEFIKNQK